ncbi:MAG: hypothetical protein ACI4BB_06405 [Coprococcus sp.]
MKMFQKAEAGIVMNVRETGTVCSGRYRLPVQGIPGKRTLKNFLATALMPVGKTLYVYGGGWNWEDTGAAVQARTIGISNDWIRFFESQDSNYTYRDTAADGKKNEYYYAGLDCSGYVGWILYNVMHTKGGQTGYVMPAVEMAKRFSERGWGEWTQDIKQMSKYKHSVFLPGDIISIDGHVWISVGTCEDGSVLILHSTPAVSRTGQPGGGPELSAVGKDKCCQAYELADYYMAQFYPEWYRRYPTALVEYDRYTAFAGEYAGKFSWDLKGENGGITDPEGYGKKMPGDILEDLFKTMIKYDKGHRG